MKTSWKGTGGPSNPSRPVIDCKPVSDRMLFYVMICRCGVTYATIWADGGLGGPECVKLLAMKHGFSYPKCACDFDIGPGLRGH